MVSFHGKDKLNWTLSKAVVICSMAQKTTNSFKGAARVSLTVITSQFLLFMMSDSCHSTTNTPAAVPSSDEDGYYHMEYK
jgi:hypothetical protein